MLCRKTMTSSRKRKTGKVPVYLNVYDLTPINGYAYWLGLGVYHSGLQVHDTEYAFGAHDQPTTGIFEVEPKRCPGFTFRKSILVGKTDLGPKEVRAFMEKLANDYTGNTYNLISKNCNHFCKDACLQLTGKHIPRWVNRLARLGFFCNCVLPAGVTETQVRQIKAEDRPPEKKKLRSYSNRKKLPVLTSWTNNNPGRRYHSCKDCKFFKWVDPPMCERAKQIIPGLLRKINSKDAENEMQLEQIKSLHMKAMEMKLEMELTMKEKSNPKLKNILSIGVIIILALVWLLHECECE